MNFTGTVSFVFILQFGVGCDFAFSFVFISPHVMFTFTIWLQNETSELMCQNRRYVRLVSLRWSVWIQIMYRLIYICFFASAVIKYHLAHRPCLVARNTNQSLIFIDSIFLCIRAGVVGSPLILSIPPRRGRLLFFKADLWSISNWIHEKHQSQCRKTATGAGSPSQF